MRGTHPNEHFYSLLATTDYVAGPGLGLGQGEVGEVTGGEQ